MDYRGEYQQYYTDDIKHRRLVKSLQSCPVPLMWGFSHYELKDKRSKEHYTNIINLLSILFRWNLKKILYHPLLSFNKFITLLLFLFIYHWLNSILWYRYPDLPLPLLIVNLNTRHTVTYTLQSLTLYGRKVNVVRSVVSNSTYKF